jgi:radical SAM protein with 4Fe4S-binding SPASM domain
LVREVDFTGGEPLLRADWPAIAHRLRELQIQVRMVTNGLLLEENITLLKDSGIATVGISLDGLENTHDFIRRCPGLFRRVVAGIEAAVKADLPAAVITAVSDINARELDSLHLFLQDLGVDYWQVQPLFSLGRVLEGKGLTLSESTFMGFGEFVRSHTGSCGKNGFTIMPADGVGYFTDLDTRLQGWKGCGAGLSSCGITSNGKIKGCLSHPDNLIEGDLRERELWSIWFDENSFKHNRLFALDDLGEACSECEFGEQCRGGCMVMSYAHTRQFHNDPYCFHGIRRRAGV